MVRQRLAALARRRLAAEKGRVDGQAPFTVALAFPCPYPVAMSSLGALHIRAAIQSEPAMACERLFLPDDAPAGALPEAPLSYESLRPLSAFPVVALPVAYELELGAVVQLLEASGIPSLREERDETDPFILAGGPLSYANPLPLAAFADAIVMGEADERALAVLRRIQGAVARDQLLDELASMPHVFVPARHGAALPSLGRCDEALLPARSVLRTPEAELSNMVLVEAARGCSRGCRYCVLRRSATAGLRVVPAERILSAVPDDAERVGLVGAAVTDHPEITEVVRGLVVRGCQVGLSSLRADRLTDELVGALRAGGYRTLTTAVDGASERLRRVVDRRIRAEHLVAAATLARQHGLARLKLYAMVGLPGEQDEDLDELVDLSRELSRLVPVSLAVSPFCAKRNTPFDGEAFAGVDVIRRRLGRLRRGLQGRVQWRAASVRWAWVEHCLAQGDERSGRVIREAVLAGGGFARIRRALEGMGAEGGPG